MFGNPMHVKIGEIGVTLRPHKESEMERLAELFSSMEIQRYLIATGAFTPKQELGWFQSTAESKDSVVWAIVPDGAKQAVGTTSLQQIHPLWGTCTSGIVIADRNYWRKGIAFNAHLCRTLFAANILNRMTIQSSARVKNIGSVKALQKVGYRISGMYDRNVFRDGEYLDTYILSWINPTKTALLYPDGVPQGLEKSLAQAKAALELAEKNVEFL
jgi:RimJ/RimL family protein N-acetyltransferase